MTNSKTTLDDHTELSRKLLRVLEDFVDEIGKRSCTAHLETVLNDGHFLKGKNLGQKPERFIEDNLIFPTLHVLDHELRPRPVQYAPRWSHGRGIPDFALTTIPISKAKQSDIRLFGESKPPNKLNYARQDMETYLNKDLDFHAISLLTDGIEWELWIRPRNEELSDKFVPYMTASLRDALMTVKNRNLEQEPYNKHNARSQIDTEQFDNFTHEGIVDIIHDKFELIHFDG